MKRYFLVLSFVLSICFIASYLFSQTSLLLNYQGKLTNKDGTVESGTVTMFFAIYADTTSKTPLWDEVQTVTVKNGVFNVLLGSVKPLSETLFTTGGDRFLGIKVGNDPEMKPRFQLTSVPYAIQPTVPRGGIILWSGAITDIPYGWALCDGKDYPRTDGQGTIKNPDLRNRFIVGAGSSYGVGATGGADNVAITISQLPSHSHPITDKVHSHAYTDVFHSETSSKKPSNISSVSVPGGWGSGSLDNDNVGWLRLNPTTSSSYTNITTTNSTGSGQAHENRPPYYALAYIMKL